jgi:hypothetical protein
MSFNARDLMVKLSGSDSEGGDRPADGGCTGANDCTNTPPPPHPGDNEGGKEPRRPGCGMGTCGCTATPPRDAAAEQMSSGILALLRQQLRETLASPQG